MKWIISTDPNEIIELGDDCFVEIVCDAIPCDIQVYPSAAERQAERDEAPSTPTE